MSEEIESDYDYTDHGDNVSEHKTQEEVHSLYREYGISPELEAQVEQVLAEYFNAVRLTVLLELHWSTKEPTDVTQRFDAWPDGLRHGTELSRAILAGRRQVENPSQPISLRRLGVLIGEMYGPHNGTANATRLRENYIDSGHYCSERRRPTWCEAAEEDS